MEASATDRDMLSLYRGPAALVTADSKLIAWNDSFAAIALRDDLAPGAQLPAQGNRVASALEHAFEGGIGVGQTMVTGEDAKESSWMLLALQQSKDSALVLLSNQGDLLRSLNDDLTGLPNRRDANSRLLLEWERMLRDDEYCFSIAMVDVDHFKLVNDHFGHNIGDELLVHLGNLLTGLLRSGDWVARWGGEEFLLFMHQTGLAEANKVAERIRGDIAKKSLQTSTGNEINLTACLGVVCSDSYVTLAEDTDSNLAQMINAADVLLYEAKQSGRNAVHSQIEGEKVFWNSSEMKQLLAGDDLKPYPTAVTNASGELAGSIWNFEVRGEGKTAQKRVYRSCYTLNFSTELDAAVLSRINAIYDPAVHGKAMFVPVSASALIDVENKPELENAVANSLAANIDLIFVLKDDEPVINVALQDALEVLNRRGIGLCVSVSQITEVPFGPFAKLDPDYALLASEVVTNEKDWQNLSELLVKNNVVPIIPSTQQNKLDKIANALLFSAD